MDAGRGVGHGEGGHATGPNSRERGAGGQGGAGGLVAPGGGGGFDCFLVADRWLTDTRGWCRVVLARRGRKLQRYPVGPLLFSTSWEVVDRGPCPPPLLRSRLRRGARRSLWRSLSEPVLSAAVRLDEQAGSLPVRPQPRRRELVSRRNRRAGSTRVR